MKKLEEIIILNKGKADFRQPAYGHEKRFINKTRKTVIKRRMLNITMYTLVAASLISFILVVPFSILNNNSTPAKMPYELSEAIYYYNNITYSLTNDIMNIKGKDISEIKQLKRDLEESDKWRKRIWNDYQRYPNDERVINALIEYHRNKAEMLHDIFEQINNLEQKTI